MANKPTVVAAGHFDPIEDCRRLHRAMAGLGTNEEEIIEILANRSAAQRQGLIKTYEEHHKKHLVKELQKELSGDFEKLVLACMDFPAVTDAKKAEKAMKGLGTNEAALIEVICTKNNAEIEKLKAAYQLTFEKSLIEDVRKDTSGDFQKLLFSLLRCERDNKDDVDAEKAEVEAKALFKAGEEKTGTDEAVFTEILCKRNYKQLKLIFEKYEKVAGHPFESAVKSEVSGELEKSYLTIIEVARDVHEYFACKINGCMKGMGTNDDDLIRYIVSRSEIDMGNIKETYSEKYKKTLEQEITGETMGDYRSMLLKLIT